jgi:hypothetical protein
VRPHSARGMPTNACQYFYACGGCQTLLKPLSGNCCVYCSYADVMCRQSRPTPPRGHLGRARRPTRRRARPAPDPTAMFTAG